MKELIHENGLHFLDKEEKSVENIGRIWLLDTKEDKCTGLQESCKVSFEIR